MLTFSSAWMLIEVLRAAVRAAKHASQDELAQLELERHIWLADRRGHRRSHRKSPLASSGQVSLT